MGTTAADHPTSRDAADVLADLAVAEAGLDPEEAARRLESSGPNELRQRKERPLWRKVLAQFQDPLVYLLFAAMAISLAAWFLEGARGVPIDVVVIAAIVILNAVIGLTQESKAEGAVAALSKMTAATSTVRRGGELLSIESAQLVPGDILVLAEGDAVGADARLLSAAGLRVQEASLTGESEAVEKSAGTLSPGTDLADRVNMVHKGTAVVQGVGQAVVTATGMDTEMGAIADMLDSTVDEPSPLDREIEKVSKMLGILVIGIAIVVMAALFLINGISSVQEAVDILLLGVSLAVAAVPEGLPAILSLVLAIGVQAMARQNAVMKSLPSVETLGAASVIASDKTGTLTRNEMTLKKVLTASGETELTGTGYDPAGTVAGTTSEAALAEARIVIAGGALANDAQLTHSQDGWRIEGDPTEAAFLVAGRKFDRLTERLGDFERHAEVPFTSERKMMSAAGLDTATRRRCLVTKGAPDVLLTHCTRVREGDAERSLHPGDRERITAEVERASAQGYRTLGVAYRELDGEPAEVGEELEEDLTFAGLVAIIDPPRAETAAAIREAHRAGIRTMMITGDHPKTAAAIGREIGLVGDAEPAALTGAQIDALSEEEFRTAVRTTDVYARVAPGHKLRIVDALQADGKIVAMTGDGVNDAPALKSADIGVAMGITGTEVTKEAAKMVLADDNYGTIVAAVRKGRGIFDNIRKFLRFLLSSNMGEVITVFFGVVLAGFIGLSAPDGALAVPLLATQILWINLITDSGPALAMGMDPDDGDLMARAPRDPQAAIIDRRMWARIIFIGAVMGAATLLSIDMFLPAGFLTLQPGSVEIARTVGFTTLVFAQLFNTLNSRSDEHSAFRQLFANRWLWAAIVLAVVLQIAVVHVPFLQVAFGTVALDPLHWAAAVGMASVVLWAEEISKLVRRLMPRRS